MQAVEHILVAIGHYSQLEKNQDNEMALQELRLAVELLQPKSNNDKSEFVTEDEAEELALKHIENYMADCHCQSDDNLRLASQKMLAMAFACMEKTHKLTEENQH